MPASQPDTIPNYRALPVRRIAVCADDFGLTESASLGILDLVQRGAICSASCLVDGPFCQTYAADLVGASDGCSIGLHVNFTECEAPYRRQQLAATILRSYTIGIGRGQDITQEIRRQFELFETIFDRAPDFLDGHQHVHQLPGIREPLLAEIKSRYGTTIAIRSTVPAHSRGFKAMIIKTLGGKTVQREAVRAGFMVNRDFAGAYDFTTRIPYGKLMRGWMSKIEDLGLIMCHPQLPHAAHPGAREVEHAFFASDEWRNMLREMNVRLVPFGVAEFAGQHAASSKTRDF